MAPSATSSAICPIAASRVGAGVTPTRERDIRHTRRSVFRVTVPAHHNVDSDIAQHTPRRVAGSTLEGAPFSAAVCGHVPPQSCGPLGRHARSSLSTERVQDTLRMTRPFHRRIPFRLHRVELCESEPQILAQRAHVRDAALRVSNFGFGHAEPSPDRARIGPFFSAEPTATAAARLARRAVCVVPGANPSCGHTSLTREHLTKNRCGFGALLL